MKSLVIWGAGGHAKVVADAARLAGWRVDTFFDELHPERNGQEFFGGRVAAEHALLPPSSTGAAAGLGIGDNAARLRCFSESNARGWALPAIIHPSAVVAGTARLGAGSFLAAGAIINPDALLADAVIVNTGASVDHDCQLEDGVHVAPGAHLAGGVRVGAGTLIGIGAVVCPGIVIGRGCIIGAGAVVTNDLPDRTTAIGIPARPRSR